MQVDFVFVKRKRRLAVVNEQLHVASPPEKLKTPLPCGCHGWNDATQQRISRNMKGPKDFKKAPLTMKEKIMHERK